MLTMMVSLGVGIAWLLCAAALCPQVAGIGTARPCNASCASFERIPNKARPGTLLMVVRMASGGWGVWGVDVAQPEREARLVLSLNAQWDSYDWIDGLPNAATVSPDGSTYYWAFGWEGCWGYCQVGAVDIAAGTMRRLFVPNGLTSLADIGMDSDGTLLAMARVDTTGDDLYAATMDPKSGELRLAHKMAPSSQQCLANSAVFPGHGAVYAPLFCSPPPDQEEEYILAGVDARSGRPIGNTSFAEYNFYDQLAGDARTGAAFSVGPAEGSLNAQCNDSGRFPLSLVSIDLASGAVRRVGSRTFHAGRDCWGPAPPVADSASRQLFSVMYTATLRQNNMRVACPYVLVHDLDTGEPLAAFLVPGALPIDIQGVGAVAFVPK